MFIGTGDADIMEHILKSNFYGYEKGDMFCKIFKDFLGDGIFNVDGAAWKKQR